MSDSTQFGVVNSFDDRRGLGEITDESGNVWPFHCAEIADGSRHVNIGQRVSFVVKFHVTRDEAFGISPA
ncbi:MAG: Cold-shock DNA-binding domain [Actinomycetota bacterium]|jgi:cold shock CspA family protein